MKVAYFHIDFPHSEAELSRALAVKSIASVRKNMPAATIVHATNYGTKAFEVDEVVRHHHDAQLLPQSGFNRADIQATIAGDVLFLDTDTLLLRDVSDVFTHEFDIAVAMPREDEFNQGVVFSRRPEFWTNVAEEARRQKRYSEKAFSDVVRSGKYKVRVLAAEYNYPPPPDLAVMHFKGRRKNLMWAM